MKLFIIAGEESGDIHASNLVRQLKKLTDISLYGTGGKRLKELGQEQYFSSEEMTIIGLDGIIKNIPLILNMFKTLKKKVEEIKPDVVVLVDYPGFNLRFAAKIRHLNIPIIYFIAPQVWAWHYSRVKKIKRLIDKVLCILPFEEEVFKKEGINAKYVGNPIVDNAIPKFNSKKLFLEQLDIRDDKKIIGMLPGSRLREVNEIMPEIIKAYDKIKDNYTFILGKAESVDLTILENFVKNRNILITEFSYDVMAYSDLLWTCSGTVTLESAYLKTPMIILYSVGRFTEMIGKLVLRLDYIGLPNIIAGNKIVPELLQDDMNYKNIIEATNWIFEHYDLVMKEIIKVSEQFSALNPSENAAKEIFSLISKKVTN